MSETIEAKKYLDQAEVIIVVLGSEGKVRLINRKGCEVLGYSEEEVLEKDWFDHFIPERIRPSVRNAFTQIFSKQPTRVEFFENPVLTRTGEEKLIAWKNAPVRNVDGLIVEVLSTGEDVTLRRQTENALIESEGTLRAILETCVDGIVTIDEKGRILSFNPAAVRIFGYSPEEVIGENVRMLMPEPYKERHASYMRRYLENGEKKIIGTGREVVGQRKDGSTFPLYLAVSQVNVGGNVMFTGITRDLTDFKKMQNEIIQAQKLAAIGEMAASVGHEIKNPLAGISGAIEILKDTLPENDSRRQVMTDILSEVERLDSTVRDLLAFSRPWNPETQACDLREIVERVARTFREQENLQNVEYVFGSSVKRRVLVDPWLLEKVVWNLLANASDAMGGEGEIEFLYQESPGYVILTIKDSGEGVPEEHHGDVFRPFFTTKSRGTGLGLAICKKIMDAHGGDIFLHSVPQKGTQVTIHLPADEESRAEEGVVQ